jgi:hypothetical protein
MKRGGVSSGKCYSRGLSAVRLISNGLEIAKGPALRVYEMGATGLVFWYHEANGVTENMSIKVRDPRLWGNVYCTTINSLHHHAFARSFELAPGQEVPNEFDAGRRAPSKGIVF